MDDAADRDGDAGAHRTVPAFSLAFHAGRQYTLSRAGLLVRDGEPIRDLRLDHAFLVSAGSRLLVAGTSGTVFEALSGRVLYRHAAALLSGSGCFGNRTPAVMFGSMAGEVIALQEDVDGGFRLVTVLARHAGPVTALASDDRHVFSVSTTDGVRFTRAVGPGLPGSSCVAVHDDVLACAPWHRGFVDICRSGVLRFWRDATLDAVHRMPLHGVACAALCPVSGLVAVGTDTGEVACFDLRTRAWLPVPGPLVGAIAAIAAVPSQPRVFTVVDREGAARTLRVR